MDTYYPEALDRGQVEVYGQELAYTGWLMCRVNIRIHQIARCLRRPWSRQQQEAFSPAPVQPKNLQPPADITIDENLRQKLLASYREAIE